MAITPLLNAIFILGP